MNPNKTPLRWVLVSLALLLSGFALAACGDDEEPTRTQTTVTTVEEKEDLTLDDILAGDEAIVGEDVEISADVSRVLAGPAAFTVAEEQDGVEAEEDAQVLVVPTEGTEVEGALGPDAVVRVRGTVERVTAGTFADEGDYLFEQGDDAFLAEFEGDLVLVADEVEVLDDAAMQQLEEEQQQEPQETPEGEATPEAEETPEAKETPEAEETPTPTATPTP